MIRAPRTLVLPLTILLVLSSLARPATTSWENPSIVSLGCNDPGLAENHPAGSSLPGASGVSLPAGLGFAAPASDEQQNRDVPVLDSPPPFTPTDFAFLPYISRPQPPLGWVPIGPAEGDALLDIDVAPNDSNRLYAATRSGIYRSMDRGANWELAVGGFFRQLVVDPKHPNILYSGPHDESYRYGIYKSTDGGDTWTHYDEGMTCDNPAALSIAATDPNILFTGSF